MRRFKQKLPDVEVGQILTRATSGVLSLIDANGLPYGVPMSFVYDGDGFIYFHCAREGRKMDGVLHGCCPWASFCIIALDDVCSEKFTTYFRSVIVEGRLTIVKRSDEMIAALQKLSEKYAPGIDSTSEIAKGIERVAILRLDIEVMSGKEAIELTSQRR